MIYAYISKKTLLDHLNNIKTSDYKRLLALLSKEYGRIESIAHTGHMEFNVLFENRKKGLAYLNNFNGRWMYRDFNREPTVLRTAAERNEAYKDLPF